MTIQGQFSVGVTDESLMSDMRTDEFTKKDDGSMYQSVTIYTAPKR